MTGSIDSTSSSSLNSYSTPASSANSSDVFNFDTLMNKLDTAMEDPTDVQWEKYNSLISQLQSLCNYSSLNSDGQSAFSTLLDASSSTARKLAKDTSPLDSLLSLFGSNPELSSAITKYPSSTVALLTYPGLIKSIANNPSLASEIINDTPENETTSVIGKLIQNEAAKDSIFTMMRQRIGEINSEIRAQQEKDIQHSEDIQQGRA